MSQGGEELAFAGAARQAEMVRAGEVSATELVGLYLDRIQRLDPQLNAFRKVFAEKAMLEAEQAEARVRAGEERPLLGVPVAIKDEVDVAGEINTHGTDAFEVPAKADSEVVRRLREAGAIIVGLTLLPELAICGFTESATYGVTRNPWNPQRTPGGSSGGSASAVAAGMVPVASAGDGAGSIRIPAA
ncbi:MAG TPA: amidase family protein, partial [Solirubrobacterales bacterium]|nr:amidase family protein [Solirubrobacterales bacterium]